ncbi:MAG TPA: aldehyde dehydrogenase (NADP(+)) [Opitutaceae bacterium]|nr:aldehyde dehydrogenase (NADP(+)) [Opitutaceae bacterium]
MKLHGLSIVAGQPVQSRGAGYRAIDPTSGLPLEPEFYEASEGDVDRAILSAAENFAELRRTPDETRARFLEEIARQIEQLGDDLLRRINAETALPLARLQSERARTCAQLRLFAGVVRDGSWVDARIDTALPDRQPLPRPDLRRMLVGLGPVVVLGASNFPLAFSVAGGDTASAFAAGCPVVAKAHPAHPGTSELVAEAIAAAARAVGLTPGIFSLIHGGPEVAQALVRHPATAAVAFTGSYQAGRALCDVAAARPHPIPVFAEMSGLNPVFILPEALRQRGAAIAQGLFASVTLGVGQFCTKPGIVFLQRGPDADAFIAQLTAAAKDAAGGVMLTPKIAEHFLEARQKILEEPDVSVLKINNVKDESRSGRSGGNVSQNAEGFGAAEKQVRPSIALTTAAQFVKSDVLRREAFGPFSLLVLVDSAADFATCANHLEGQLTATVHEANSELAAHAALLHVLERKVGRMLINGFPTGVEVSPAMQHGGPFPAASDPRFTSVGTAALLRFARPICYQGFPDALLPEALKNSNPRKLLRMVNGQPTRESIA